MIQARRSAHRGSVLATGFVIDPAVVGAAEARRRVLALWLPGARVHEHAGALVVTGLPLVRVRTHLAPGAPIVAQHGVLAAMPIDAAEAAVLAAPDTVAITREGAAEVVSLHAARAVDVAGWIDLAGFEIARVEALAAPPEVVVTPPAPGDLRTLVGVAPADADAEHLAAALARAGEGLAGRRGSLWQRFVEWCSERLSRRSARTGTSDGDAASAVRARSRRRSAVDASPRPSTDAGSREAPTDAGSREAPAATGSLARSSRAGSPDRSGAAASGRATGVTLFRPSWLDRLRSRIAAALWQSRLGDVLGRRHAAYLRRLLELFDRGDLDQALRHAVPLGGGHAPAVRLGLAVPRPRKDLRLSLSAPGPGAAIPVGDAALEMIRERYRAAAAQLERSGRIEEAAFVLAELLADVEAAIALLERHARFALAAQLAEVRGLAPGLVVRLWFLAGDRRRAIWNAQHHRAWADAIDRLERAGDSRAASLRSMWADHLADIGDFLQAVEVVWPLPLARPVLQIWIDRGIAGGGAVAARLLIKKLVIAPGSLSAVAPAILGILADRDPDAARWRLALVDELVAAPPSAELETVARHAYRALVRDCAAGSVDVRPVLPRLVDVAGDAALRADQPVLPAPRGMSSGRPETLALRWPMADAGALAVHDAACLPGSRFLVALGELGVRIIGRDERTIAHIDQPATRLAVSDLGTRAIAIAPRRPVHRLARLELVERRGAHWCDVELDGFARSFDGDLWIASRGRSVVAVDTTDARWRAVWGVDVDPPEAVCAVRRDGAWFAIEALARRRGELWYYEGFTLRRRLEEPDELWLPLAARPSARTWIAASRGLLRGPDWSLVLEDALPTALEVGGNLVVVALCGPAGMIAIAVDVNAQRVLARLYLDGATAISLRLDGWILTVADDRGRLIVVDLLHGTLQRDLRIS